MIVLDAWAIVALLKQEPAGERVQRAIDTEEVAVSAVNLGECHYTLVRESGDEAAVDAAIDGVRRAVHVDLPDWPLVRSAAQLKATRRLSYADAFCVATGWRHHGPVWTGDPEIIGVADVVDVVDLRSGA